MTSGDRNLAKVEAARRLACLQQGAFWIGTEKALTKQRHYNMVFLHARRKTFPAYAEIVLVVQEVWPWGEVVSVEEVESRLAGQWPANLVDVMHSASGSSFPSGHVMSYIAFWGLIFSFTLILFKGRHWWRTTLLIVSGLFVVLIGPSRIYLGAHWASDVLGAYLMV